MLYTSERQALLVSSAKSSYLRQINISNCEKRQRSTCSMGIAMNYYSVVCYLTSEIIS